MGKRNAKDAMAVNCRWARVLSLMHFPLAAVVELHPADILHPLRGQRLATAIDRNGQKRARRVLQSGRVRSDIALVVETRR